MPEFIQGLELSRLFYLEAVKPILEADFPALRYAAALTGSGSEILGFDTEMSADHYWGARLMLFLKEKDIAESGIKLLKKIEKKEICKYNRKWKANSKQ